MRGDDTRETPDSIVLNESQVARLASLFEQSWGRPPKPQELQGVIDEHLREEVYYREALKLGLDSDDPVIRRRLRQKLEFMLVGETPEPTAAELQDFYDQNNSRYTRGPVYHFEQVYLGTSVDTLAAVQEKLEQGVEYRKAGAPINLPSAMSDVDPAAVQRIFGEDFSAALAHLEPGNWAGPVWSGYGAHLVRIRDKQAAEVPALDQVRRQLVNDWKSRQRRQAEEAAFERLAAGYQIEVADLPDAAVSPSTSVP